MNNLKYLFLSIILILCFEASAQQVQWARQITSEGFDECLDLTTDASGNVYATGQIEFIANFNGLLLESAGVHDIFVAKYDSSGNLLWAKRAGGIGGDKGQSIAVDGSGNVFIVGEIDDTSYFDTIQVVPRDKNNLFVAKYNSNGEAQWVRHIESDSLNTRGYGIACDAGGNVYACGAMQYNAYYNGSLILTSNGDYDGILLKFDANGNFKWIKQIGGSGIDKANGIALKGKDLYVTGRFEGNADFTSSVSLTSYGAADFFIAKYDTAGVFKWARKGGDTDDDSGYDITINVNGDVVCTGDFTGQGQFGGNTVFSNGLADMFLVAYNSTGTARWAIKGGGVENDIGRNITHDDNGNLYVGGDYADTGYFPPFSAVSNGFADIFLVSYDSLGTTGRFLKSYGGSINDRGRGVAVDPRGNINFSGEFNDSIDFGNIHIVGDTNLDIFILQLRDQLICSANVVAAGNILCAGTCNGSLNATASGSAPYTYQWSTSPPQYTSSISGLCAGTYSVTISDANSCIGTATISLTDPDSIRFSGSTFTNSTCTGCNNGSININIVGGTSPYSYQWYDGDTTPQRTGLSPGLYNVCVTDINNCSACYTFSITEPPSGISTLENWNSLIVYPNPTVGDFFIKIGNDFSLVNRRLNIYSVAGALIKTIALSEHTSQLSAQEFSKGFYLIEVQDEKTGERVLTTPLFIQ